MAEATLKDAVTHLLAVLREAFEGPPEKWSYFTDSGPEAGFFGTIAKLTAEQASKKIGNTSIAAHVHHTNFSLKAMADWLQGKRDRLDWKESWSVSTVDESGWDEMRKRMHDEYLEVKKRIESDACRDEMSLGGAIGSMAHFGYHLGAVRQKTAFL